VHPLAHPFLEFLPRHRYGGEELGGALGELRENEGAWTMERTASRLVMRRALSPPPSTRSTTSGASLSPPHHVPTNAAHRYVSTLKQCAPLHSPVSTFTRGRRWAEVVRGGTACGVGQRGGTACGVGSAATGASRHRDSQRQTDLWRRWSG